MIFKLPKYYKYFRCKADKCTESCCIGWEIDIDSDTVQKYKAQKGELGKMLRDNTTLEKGVYSFKLKDGDRCPFLDCDGLCKLIKLGGEELLCEICREHPRYYTNLGSFGTGGLGIVCEEAARLLLECEKGEGFDVAEMDAEEYECEDRDYAEYLWQLEDIIYEGLFKTDKALARLSLLALNENEEISKEEAFLIMKKTEDISAVFGTPLSIIRDNYLRTEPLTEDFLPDVSKALLLAEESQASFFEYLVSDFNSIAAKLCAYFLHRYLFEGYFDGEIKQRLSFICDAVTVIGALCFNGKSPEAAVREFSKNIEYNTDNISLLLN